MSVFCVLGGGEGEHEALQLVLIFSPDSSMTSVYVNTYTIDYDLNTSQSL
jgi:hypothetical protein